MGLVHREQPKISEESIRPLFVIAPVVPLTRPMKPPAHHRPQSTANKAVDGRERVLMRMLEIAKPSFQDGVERCNYACERIPQVRLVRSRILSRNAFRLFWRTQRWPASNRYPRNSKPSPAIRQSPTWVLSG